MAMHYEQLQQMSDTQQRMLANRRGVRERAQKRSFDYDYPRGLDLRPGTDLHDRLVDMVNEHAFASEQVVQNVRSDWKKYDWAMSAYVPDTAFQQRNKQQNWRQPVNVVIPSLWAQLETYITYLMGTFVQGDIHRYQGVGGKEGLIKGSLMQRVVGLQSMWFREPLALNTMFRDSIVYGCGFLMVEWRKHRSDSIQTMVVDEIMEAMLNTDMGLGFREGDVVRYVEERLLWEGNKLVNIDPYQIVLDPNTPVHRIQEAAYCGYKWKTHDMDILGRERDPEERLFNGRYVQVYAEGGMARSVHQQHEYHGRGDRQATGRDHMGVESQSSRINREVHCTTIFKDLIPSEEGLGDEDHPVTWMITVAADEVVVQCDKLGLLHGQKPIVSAAPNTTGYDLLPVSHVAMGYPEQKLIDWIVTSYGQNVSKMINDMIIAHPRYVEMQDLLNPNPAKIIRLKANAFHDLANPPSIDAFVKQLNVQDVSQQHLLAAGNFLDIMNRVMGTQDIVQGDMSGMPERPTQQGLQMAQQNAFSRLGRIAMLIDLQAFYDLGLQMAMNTIQFMSQDVIVSVAGRHEEYLRSEYQLGEGEEDFEVGVFDLDENFRVEPRIRTVNQTDNIQGLSKVMEIALQNPDFMARSLSGLDLPNMMIQFLRKSGVQDIHEFKLQGGQAPGVQVMPNEQVQQQAQAGNLVPMEQMQGPAQ